MPDSAHTRLPVRRGERGPFRGLALAEGEDVVAAGGGLSPELLRHAYRHGVFPWYERSGPVLWWCPDPRAVLPLHALHVPRRLARTLRRAPWRMSRDEAFEAVVRACAERRPEGTWLHPEMIEAYVGLAREGAARSFEVWEGPELVGGLYGVPVPPVFCAESMFHARRDASKAALVAACHALEAEGFTHLEVQFLTPHLAPFGVVELPRAAYLRLLDPDGRS